MRHDKKNREKDSERKIFEEIIVNISQDRQKMLGTSSFMNLKSIHTAQQTKINRKTCYLTPE